MRTVYECLAINVVWIVLGSRQVWGFDPYPYPFLLFMGNVVQLLLTFIILLGQQALGRTTNQRAIQTYQDAEAILHDCEQLQNHLTAQDQALSACSNLPVEEQKTLARAAQALETPPMLADEYVGFNGRLAAWITTKIGTMTAFYIAVIIQSGWMVAGQLSGIDPYPYPFLLFLSSLAQLLLMFVITVGQQVMGQATDKRAKQTYLNTEAVLHAYERLHAHLRAQDLVIHQIVNQLTEYHDQRSKTRND